MQLVAGLKAKQSAQRNGTIDATSVFSLSDCQIE